MSKIINILIVTMLMFLTAIMMIMPDDLKVEATGEGGGGGDGGIGLDFQYIYIM